MTRLRAAYAALLALPLLLAACSDGNNGPPAPGDVTVVILTDPNYFDYDEADNGSEASNMLFTLNDLGYNTRPVGVLSADSVIAALAGAQVLVVPEEEVSEIDSAIAAQGLDTIFVQFVQHGGILVSSSNFGFLNTSFGWSLSDSYVGSDTFVFNSHLTGSSRFSGVADTLADNDATDWVTAASLPSGAIAPWRNDSSEAPLVAAPYGSGWVLWLGYDWYDAKPFGSQDGGWVEALKRINRF